MSAPDIPDKYTIKSETDADITLGGSITANTNLGGTITANTNLGGTLTTNSNLGGSLSLTVLGDANKPIGAKVDAAVEIVNLPRFTINDFLTLIDAVKKPDLRARFPVQLRFGISVFPLNLFGVDALQFSICGEPQVILEPYRPNAFERCEVDCEPCGCD
jgi:hypothetical protein